MKAFKNIKELDGEWMCFRWKQKLADAEAVAFTLSFKPLRGNWDGKKIESKNLNLINPIGSHDFSPSQTDFVEQRSLSQETERASPFPSSPRFWIFKHENYELRACSSKKKEFQASVALILIGVYWFPPLRSVVSSFLTYRYFFLFSGSFSYEFVHTFIIVNRNWIKFIVSHRRWNGKEWML